MCSVYCDADCGQSSIFQKEAFASAVRSRCFHELCMSGTMVRNLVFGLLAQSRFSCSRSQRAKVPNLDNCWGFSSNPSKVYVQLSSWFACQMVPERCECRDWDSVRKHTHLPTSASSNYHNKLSTDAKYMCHDFKKEILVLPIIWFHTAISVMTISEYCKEFAAFVVLASCIYSIARYWFS